MPTLTSISGLARFVPTTCHIFPFHCSRIRRIHNVSSNENVLRADRNSETFSVVVMAPRNRQHGAKMFPELIRVLHARLRATDDVGQIEGDRLGILLPDTPSAGAWTVVDHVVHLLPKDVLSPICEVYTYPSFGDEESEMEDRTDAGKPNGIPVALEDTGVVDGESREVRRMESLFMISLPAWKRGLDIVGASLGLLVLSPPSCVYRDCGQADFPGPSLLSAVSPWPRRTGLRALQISLDG